MQNLEFNNKTIDSREVAVMLDKEHGNLLKDIERYADYLRKVKINFSEFFIESNYKTNKNNKSYKNYQITKKGCEFLAHKLTGQKGAVFTAKYINAFEALQTNTNSISNNQDIMQMLVLSQKNMLDMINVLNKKIDSVQNAPMIQIKEEKPLSKKQIQDKNLQKLIKRQALPARLKILKFPTKIIDMVDTLLSQEKISYAYIRKILKEKGCSISYNSIVNYHKAIKGGF